MPDGGLSRRAALRSAVARCAQAGLATLSATLETSDKEFWGLDVRLVPETLVPRPDTEILVEAALKAVPDHRAPLRVLDLGTGSGCILVALLRELPNAHGVGLDRSPAALRTARENADANGVGGRAGVVARGGWGALRGAVARGAQAVRRLARAAGLSDRGVSRDLAGHHRVLIFGPSDDQSFAEVAPGDDGVEKMLVAEGADR